MIKKPRLQLEEKKYLNLSSIPKDILNEISQKYLNTSDISNLLQKDTLLGKVNQKILDNWKECQKETIHGTKCIPQENREYIKRMQSLSSSPSSIFDNDGMMRKCNKYCKYYENFSDNGWKELQYSDLDYYNEEEKKNFTNSKVILFNSETNQIGTAGIQSIYYTLTFSYDSDIEIRKQVDAQFDNNDNNDIEVDYGEQFKGKYKDDNANNGDDDDDGGPLDNDNDDENNGDDGGRLEPMTSGQISFHVYPYHQAIYCVGSMENINHNLEHLFHSLMKLIPNRIDINIKLKLDDKDFVKISNNDGIQSSNDNNDNHEMKQILLLFDDTGTNDRLYIPGNNQWWNWTYSDNHGATSRDIVLNKYKNIKPMSEKIDKDIVENMINSSKSQIKFPPPWLQGYDNSLEYF